MRANEMDSISRHSDGATRSAIEMRGPFRHNQEQRSTATKQI
jgi:hypothetical protein